MRRRDAPDIAVTAMRRRLGPRAASPAQRRSTNPVSARRHQPAPAADPAAAAPGASTEIGRNTTSPRGSRASEAGSRPRRNRWPPAPPPSPSRRASCATRGAKPAAAQRNQLVMKAPAERARRRHERIFPERGQFHHRIAFGQTVRGWAGDQHRLAQQGLEMQTRRADAGMAHEADVGASQFQRLDLLARGRLAQRERHGGMPRGNAATRAAAIHREKY